MTLTQLRYLVAIADAGFNITQAAERVHTTQPLQPGMDAAQTRFFGLRRECGLHFDEPATGSGG